MTLYEATGFFPLQLFFDYLKKGKCQQYIFTGRTGLSQVTPVHHLMYEDFERYEIIPETVDEYTGLLDKKKKRIFEGDIVEFTFFYYGEIEIEEHKKGVMEFDKCSFIFVSETERYFLSDLTFDSESDIEIIGNRFDNPDLLDRNKIEEKNMLKWRKVDTWRYYDTNENFAVKVVKWYDGTGKTIWNKYLYLFRGNKHFGKYRPNEDENYPDTPFDFHCGITFYHENFDKDGNLIRQKIGDDYNHVWDLEMPVDSEGISVFMDAEKLIEEVRNKEETE
jgi:uncharacterized phage protein (TIGR01671 family)